MSKMPHHGYRIAGFSVALTLLSVGLFYIPAPNAQAYSQGYYQSYYQGGYYSQSYYQSYYQAGYYTQGAYGTTLTENVSITGSVSVLGAISKGSGTFAIDHPLEPRDMLLFHSFVESPDVKNIYDGVATLDGNGEVTITLPRYFLALNKDFRYQATALGVPAPDLHLKKGVERRFFGLFGEPVFTIAGGNAGQTISWQVTGIRHDPYIEKNPIVVEVEKGPNTLVEKGEYLIPDVYE